MAGSSLALGGLLVLASPPLNLVGSPPTDATESTEASNAEGPEVEARTMDSDIGRLSQGGDDSGAFELGLGSVVTVVGLGLIVAGSIDLRSGIERKRFCEVQWTENCNLDPPGLIYTSSVLAFTFSVPALVGGALLLNKGAKINRDYRAVRRAQSSVAFIPARSGRQRARGGVLSWRLRF